MSFGQPTIKTCKSVLVTMYIMLVIPNGLYLALCSAGKCRIAGKGHNLRKMSHRRRERSQSAENVVNPITGICRIVDGKCRKKIRCRYMSQHRRERSQLLLILHFGDFELISDCYDFY